MGILAWNRAKQPRFEPMGVGWASASDGPHGRSYTLHDDASRAQLGNPNHLDVYLLDASLTYLSGHGIEAISSHVCGLANRLFDRLESLDVALITPRAPEERAGARKSAGISRVPWCSNW